MKSDLPIIARPTESPKSGRSASSKYGGVYWLSIFGLVVLSGLIGWFGIGFWQMRGVWRDVYTMNDAKAAIESRVDAAWELTRTSSVSQRQFFDLAISRVPPEPARYLCAEALTSGVVKSEPRGFAIAVARSEGWPAWLRVLMTRALVYAAADGVALPPDALDELRSNLDPGVRLWAEAAVAFGGGERAASARAFLLAAAEGDGWEGALARLLHQATSHPHGGSWDWLDRATEWMREGHPDARRVWAGWRAGTDGRPERAQDAGEADRPGQPGNASDGSIK
jgi:hypothetical protein